MKDILNDQIKVWRVHTTLEKLTKDNYSKAQ